MSPFFSPLLEPLGAVWLLMALGLLWLVWRRQWRCAVWLGLPTLLLWLVGATPLVDALVERAEQPYARPLDSNLPLAEAVVALGGGQTVSQHDLLGFSIGEAGDRVLTAVELVRRGKARALVLGGSLYPLPGKPDAPAISPVQDWILAWRVTSGMVTNLGLCRDTHDEAAAFRKLNDAQGWHQVILVTSALHMPRSVAVFKKQGLDVVPVAADFQVAGVPQPPGTFSPFPRQDRFVRFSLYLHERIGWWVYKWRGWI